MFTVDLAKGLSGLGADVELQAFPKWFEPAPMLLRNVRPPRGTTAVLANSWNAFAFAHEGVRLACVEHLFVLDPSYAPFRSTFQRIAHSVLVRGFLRRSYEACDVLVAPSRYTAAAISSWLPSAAPSVILNGVDTDFFRPAPRRRSRVRKLLFISTHSKRKGYDLLPMIMARLRSGYELSVAGEREAGSVLQANFLGYLNREGVRRAFQEADVLLMPSHLEGLSLAALEAMACGTPVIAFDTSSFPEIVDHGKDGMLAPHGDVAGFADAVAEATADDASLGAMADAANQTARKRFDHNRTLREYCGLLTGLGQRK